MPTEIIKRKKILEEGAIEFIRSIEPHVLRVVAALPLSSAALSERTGLSVSTIKTYIAKSMDAAKSVTGLDRVTREDLGYMYRVWREKSHEKVR